VILTAALAFAQEVPQREVFFGETPVHASWSFGPYVFGNHITGPADAYKYAVGKPIDHLNVFFKDCKKVSEMPFSSLDSQAPEDLWAWMDTQRQAGHELLAIAHNANLSDGIMFPTEVDFKGWPIDAAWAEAGMRNERLQEIKQSAGVRGGGAGDQIGMGGRAARRVQARSV
jgi:Protein of unknown function (DUF3604)